MSALSPPPSSAALAAWLALLRQEQLAACLMDELRGHLSSCDGALHLLQSSALDTKSRGVLEILAARTAALRELLALASDYAERRATRSGPSHADLRSRGNGLLELSAALLDAELGRSSPAASWLRVKGGPLQVPRDSERLLVALVELLRPAARRQVPLLAEVQARDLEACTISLRGEALPPASTLRFAARLLAPLRGEIARTRDRLTLQLGSLPTPAPAGSARPSASALPPRDASVAALPRGAP